jgi:hypothetical protein
MPKKSPDWSRLDPLIDNLKAQGWNDTQVAKDLHIARQTLVDHLRSRELVHPSTPEVRSGTPEPQGTLEDHHEVMEDIQQSVPDAPHFGTEETYQSTLEHLSTPEVHPEVSIDDSSMAHPSVPARQDHFISTPMVHPGTPSEEDWQLWRSIRAQWGEVEKMLAERHTRQSLLSTPAGTPRNTVKKTYVVDTFYVELIDRYAKEHSLDLKDVLNVAFQRFFEQEGYLSQ